MKSLEKLKKVFDDISITDEQKSALDEFFAEFYENVEIKVKENLEAEYTEASTFDENEYVAKDVALEALKLQREDFLVDGQKAFDSAIVDLKTELSEEYSEKFSNALDEMYESIYERVGKDFNEGGEGKALAAVKAAVLPLVINEDNVHLVEKIQTLEVKLHELNEEKEELSRKEIINNLVDDIDESDKEAVVEFIESAKTEDEIYERFNAIMSLIEKRKITNSISEDVEETEEEIEEVNEETTSEDEELETVFESETAEVSAPKKNPYMNELERKIVDKVFGGRRFSAK